MKNAFSDKSNAERMAREAMHRRKWSKAIEYYAKKLQENERDLALWNLLGDLHMNNKARSQAVEAWRRAMDGYALEGLFENVLGVGRKILRLVPEEDDVHLLLAEAYLGLEYHADCLASLRSYLKLCRHRSESDLRSLFKKICEQPIRHVHLLDELDSLYKDTGIEDIELERRIQEVVRSGRASVEHSAAPQQSAAADWKYQHAAPEEEPEVSGDDLITLSGMETFPEDTSPEPAEAAHPANVNEPQPPDPPVSSYMDREEPGALDLPAGEGKDHLDLGIVYKEMTLWDAAIAEFEHARRDPTVRTQATLALAECLQESHDLQGALALLEDEAKRGESLGTERLPLIHQLGIVHELLGNLQEALGLFEMVRDQRPGFGDVESRINSLHSRLGGRAD